MERKLLGKIEKAEFGLVWDRPFLMGLQLTFSMDGSGIGDGLIHTVNMDVDCKWANGHQRLLAMANAMEGVYSVLTVAKARTVADLKGKPVEITLSGNMFKSFRILTEVL